jgi:hypothetical protein
MSFEIRRMFGRLQPLREVGADVDAVACASGGTHLQHEFALEPHRQAAPPSGRRELRMPLPQKTLDIDDDTYAFIAARTAVVGESVSDILRRELRLAGGGTPAPLPPQPPGTQPSPAPPPPSPATVIFHIPGGTGRGPWNDGSGRVVAKVGDILRIINDDSVAHRLHTSGRPFPHPEADIFPGGTADFVLQTPFDPSTDGPLSDHDQGPQALFFLEVAPATRDR